MNRTSRLALLALALCPAPSLHAEPYSVEQAVRAALAHSPALQAAERQVEAARARTEAARGARWPQLDLRYSARRSDNPLDAFGDKLLTRSVSGADFDPLTLNDPDPSRLHSAELALSWPIYTGGRVSAAIRQADRHEQAARLGYERQRELLAFRVRQTYLDAQAAQVQEHIAADAATAAHTHAATAARLVREGRAAASDRLTAELHHTALESAREQAARRARQALDALRHLLHLPPQAPVELEPWRDPAPAGRPSLQDSERRALERRRDLQAAAAAVEAGRAGIAGARAAFLPQLGLVASQQWYDRDPALEHRAQSVAGVVSVNLFRGGADRSVLGAAHRLTEESELRVAELRRAILQEVAAVHHELNEAAARRALSERNADKARENAQLVNRRYGEGRTLLIELLQAERLLTEARREALDSALADAVARARLGLAEGAPLEP